MHVTHGTARKMSIWDDHSVTLSIWRFIIIDFLHRVGTTVEQGYISIRIFYTTHVCWSLWPILCVAVSISNRRESDIESVKFVAVFPIPAPLSPRPQQVPLIVLSRWERRRSVHCCCRRVLTFALVASPALFRSKRRLQPQLLLLPRFIPV